MAKRLHRGSLAWGALAALVLAWDLLAPDGQTMSEAFRRSCARPRARNAVRAAWVLLTAHLFGLLPRCLDPLHAVHVARDRARRRHVVLVR